MIKIILLAIWKLLWLPVYFIELLLSNHNPFNYKLYMLIDINDVRIQISPWLGILLCIIEWYIVYLIYNTTNRQKSKSNDPIKHLVE